MDGIPEDVGTSRGPERPENADGASSTSCSLQPGGVRDVARRAVSSENPLEIRPERPRAEGSADITCVTGNEL
jgi:hypothetical protein